MWSGRPRFQALYLLHHLRSVWRLLRRGHQPRAHLRRREYIRAAPGLTGFTKCGGNYAASIKAGELAEEQGYAQVLWLDGVEKKYVEEVGSMNIMFKIDGKVYTAATVGTVLRRHPPQLHRAAEGLGL